MQGRWKYPALAAGAVSGLGLLVTGALLVLVSPDDYRDEVQAAAGKAGVALTLEAPLRWQLWPPGVQTGALQLQDRASGLPLLRAAEAHAALDIGSLLRLSPAFRELHLQGATLHWQATDAGNNWQALLAHWQAQAASAVSLRLEDSELHWQRGATAQRVDIRALTLAAPAADGRRTLTSQLRISYQHDGDNLLLEPQLAARVTTGTDALLLHDLVAEGELAGTRFPGVLGFRVLGDATLRDGVFALPAWQANGHYRRIGMDTALPWGGSGALVLGADGLRLGAAQFFTGNAAAPALAASGDITVIPARAGLQLSWQQGRLQAGALTLENITLQGALAEGRLLAETLRATQGTGTLALPFVLSREDGEPLLSLRPELRGLPLAPWLALLGNGEGAAGTLDLNGELQLKGFSLAAWQQSARGRLTLTLQDAVLPGADLNGRLAERLASQQAFLPPLAAAATGGVDLKRLQLHNVLAEGRIDSLVEADTGRARLEAEGRYDSSARVLAYRGVLTLLPVLFSARTQPLELPLTCGSDLAATGLEFLEALSADCRIEEGAQRALMAQALRERFLSP